MHGSRRPMVESRGSRKARVLPEPVAEARTTLSPREIGPKAASCQEGGCQRHTASVQHAARRGRHAPGSGAAAPNPRPAAAA